MAVDIPELDHPGKKGSLRSKWFPMVITEAATFNVVILIAASHYAATHSIYGSAEILYRLKQDALWAIKRALQDAAVEVTDQLIGAVAKMASYEAMFGTEAQYHIHMTGLVKMIDLRGGLESLLALDGLLARMCLWIDLNSAFLLGTKLYFSHAKSLPGHSIPAPNPGHFLGES